MWTSPHRVRAGILGAADGVTSISGVVAGGAAAGVGHVALAVTAIGGAFAATVSMAGAELLSETSTDWKSIQTIGGGTLVGAGIPAVPLLFLRGWIGWAAVAVVSMFVAVAVGETRYRSSRRSRKKAYVLTFAVLAAGGIVGWVAGRFL